MGDVRRQLTEVRVEIAGCAIVRRSRFVKLIRRLGPVPSHRVGISPETASLWARLLGCDAWMQARGAKPTTRRHDHALVAASRVCQ